jgi:hypothetical protein
MGIPLDVIKSTHVDCSLHRSLIEKSKIVGCFYCMSMFLPSTIKEWIDDGQTALCPICHIDAVLPDSVGLDDELLGAMHNYWFER